MGSGAASFSGPQTNGGKRSAGERRVVRGRMHAGLGTVFALNRSNCEGGVAGSPNRRDDRNLALKGYRMASMIMNRTWKVARQGGRRDAQPPIIICPVKFQDRDTLALRYASQLARQRGGRLIAVHVVEPASSDGDSTGESRFEAALSRLEQLLPHQPDIHCEWVVLEGDVADQIVELAASFESPQIVMVRRDRNEDGGPQMGRAAVQVSRRAPCPVVVVNEMDVGAPAQLAQLSHEAGRAACMS